MNELSLISESLASLQILARKEVIFLEDLPKQFRRDMQSYIVGETLSLRDGKMAIGRNLYMRWLLKINTKGFDYEIDWKE
ncbi:hypothetical protein [Paraflavitalea sp. CAU 1676]|uniref:hypothetical protein n=1 Tax=Paraflavitalea sp. CAU 1676 TaxID=3032598 RepID=UPI0023DAC8EC|nr:hypothetical protein [Paraflavitalea sp. CAU 1676]MDF2189702.1 hypothetical protein [Paraflavitalea sp. CAU 1676]